MKFSAACLLLFLTFVPYTVAQRGGGGGARGGTRNVAPPTTRQGTQSTLNTSYFLRGKVVIDDGSELPQGAAIQTICRGQKQPTNTYTDSKGNFSFELGSSRSTLTSSAGVTDADTSWSAPS